MVELSILIISYQCRSEVLDCLASVYRHPPPCPFEVIMLDNASIDGTASAVAAQFPQVRVIRSPDNLGFAQGNNVAADHARGRRLLLLNPDTLVFADSLPALCAFADANTTARIWGGRTLFADGRLNPASCWGDITLWSLMCSAVGLTRAFPAHPLFNPEAYGGWPRDTIRAVDIVSGCYLLIDHDLWRALGGFDRRFFMYAEEADLCRRARAHGARPMITPASTIIHLGGASEARQVDKVIKIHRGRITLIRKHWGTTRREVALALYRLWAGLRCVGAHITHGPRDIPSEAKAKWREIWHRRHEWLAGYEP